MLTTRRAVLGAGAAGAAVLAAGCQPNAAQASEQLADLLERAATEFLRQSPEFSSSLGVTEERAGGRFIDRLTDNSREGTQAFVSFVNNTLDDSAAFRAVCCRRASK